MATTAAGLGGSAGFASIVHRCFVRGTRKKEQDETSNMSTSH
jgi:hypothetical protein